MKKLYVLVLLSLLYCGAFAQQKGIPVVMEIAQVSTRYDEPSLEVLQMPENEHDRYFLLAGTMGIGNAVIQFHIDPINKLYIPLGDTLSQAVETLQDLQEMFKNPDETREIQGCFVPLFPDDSRETVRVTSRKQLLGRILEFTIDREDHLRSTSVSRSDFNTLLFAVKGYQKLHPDE